MSRRVTHCCGRVSAAFEFNVIGTASRVDEALQNMKLSCRGSLRKATNTIQCVFMVRSLMTFGLTDTMTFVRQWNAMSARQFQIVGKRAQTLKLLFDNAPAATTSAFGRSALKLSVENLTFSLLRLSWTRSWPMWATCPGTKKLYPKFQFTCKTKSWLPRLKTSEKSMELCVLQLQRLHEKKPEYQRKKPDCAVVEECSQLAALAANLVQEIQLVAPISKTKIDENFLTPFSEGCALIQKELEVALLEKSDKFDVRSIPTFRRLIEEQAFSRPVSVSKIEEDSLAADRLALVLKQCKYDQQVFETWTRKVNSAKVIREQTEHEWKLGQSKKCEAVAEIYLKSCLHLAVWDVKVPERSISEIMDFKKNTVMANSALRTLQM